MMDPVLNRCSILVSFRGNSSYRKNTYALKGEVWDPDYNQLPYSGHCRDLELVSSLARVRNSGSLFQSNFCNLFLPGIWPLSVLSGCALWRGVSKPKVDCVHGHLAKFLNGRIFYLCNSFALNHPNSVTNCSTACCLPLKNLSMYVCSVSVWTKGVSVQGLSVQKFCQPWPV